MWAHYKAERPRIQFHFTRWGATIASVRYVFIGVGLAAVMVSVAVWHREHQWTLLLGGAAFIFMGLGRKEMHRPNWSPPTSLRG